MVFISPIILYYVFTSIFYQMETTEAALRSISQRFEALHLMEKLEGSKNLLKSLSNFNVHDHLFESIKEVWKNHTNFFYFNQCLVDLMNVGVALVKGELWAISMVDSFGKVGEGILNGNLHWPGSYYQCLERPEVYSTMSIKEREHLINTSYCWTTFALNTTAMDSKGGSKIKSIEEHTSKQLLSLKIAICVPNSCTENYLEKLFRTLGDTISAPLVKKAMHLESVSCVNDADITQDPVGLIGLVICAIFVILMITSTIFDVKWQNKAVLISASGSQSLDSDNENNVNHSLLNGPANTGTCSLVKEIFLAFSIYSNLGKIFSKNDSNDTLTCIHGIRVLSLAWVILGHTFLYAAQNADNMLAGAIKVQGFWGQIIPQGVFAVDSFYVISGLLVGYAYLKTRNGKSGSNFNWPYYFLHRYWRLTPPLLLTMFLFQISLFPYLGSGPFWPKDGIEKDRCRYTWWYNALYINSWFNSIDVCFDITWFVANDFQFYVIAPIILIPLIYTRYSFISAFFGVLLLAASFVVSGLIAVRNNLPAGITGIVQEHNLHDLKYLLPYYDKLYCKPFFHVGPFIVGLFLGWAIYKVKCNWKMKPAFAGLMWGLMLTMGFAVIFGLYHTKLHHPYTAIYLVLAPTIWSLSLGWILFACCTGNGGLIATLLSSTFWTPWSRISYCTYLIQFLVLNVRHLGVEEPVHIDTYSMVHSFVSNLVISFVMGLIISLAFESPFMQIEKTIMKRFTRNYT